MLWLKLTRPTLRVLGGRASGAQSARGCCGPLSGGRRALHPSHTGAGLRWAVRQVKGRRLLRNAINCFLFQVHTTSSSTQLRLLCIMVLVRCVIEVLDLHQAPPFEEHKLFIFMYSLISYIFSSIGLLSLLVHQSCSGV